MDLGKAFDRVNHDLLLLKLNKMDFINCLVKWFKSFLSGRMQREKFNNATSKTILGFIKRWSKEITDPLVTKQLYISSVRSLLDMALLSGSPFMQCILISNKFYCSLCVVMGGVMKHFPFMKPDLI